ncbi:MAG: class I SAM-dependent methyltransferase [Patescibacteria group bacterium]|nr:class I SAM-dependent methyltransferase [Patescibacteria group bacterium]
MEHVTLTTEPADGYALLDSGNEEKLERYGEYVLARPDPEALWPKRLPESEWKKADARYERKGKGGAWHVRNELPKEWRVGFGGCAFLIRPTSFKHTGLFPEQEPNWRWVDECVRARAGGARVLNLFAYTGGATLAAARAGAEVVHLDASKTAVEWARANAAASGLSEKPIRWILDDALAFVKKEERRGSHYDGIIMDPPAFGHGPKDELWKIEEHFLPLMEACKKLLSESPLFFLVNGYASGYSPLMFAHNLASLGSRIEYGELTIRESGDDGRLLPAGIFARWQKS